MKDLSEDECWTRAYDLYAAGDVALAAQFCLSEECVNSVKCKNFAGWYCYNASLFELANQQFKLAALKGDAEAHFGIGSVYYALGEYEESIALFRQASLLGYKRAFHWIGGMYRDGLGVPRDHCKSIEFFRLGSAAGYLVAERGLIHMENVKYGYFRRLLNMPRYLFLLLRAFFIAGRNLNDERIADAPNVFK